MLPSSKLDITPFSKSAWVTRTRHKYRKIKVIEVNQKRTTISKVNQLFN